MVFGKSCSNSDWGCSQYIWDLVDVREGVLCVTVIVVRNGIDNPSSDPGWSVNTVGNLFSVLQLLNCRKY